MEGRCIDLMKLFLYPSVLLLLPELVQQKAFCLLCQLILTGMVFCIQCCLQRSEQSLPRPYWPSTVLIKYLRLHLYKQSRRNFREKPCT